ncbi:hypothetical protein GPECTOR_53g101 [Gonium pectorale]|uniref:Uncharacterized protein n=1 Tax=Gonium pectorale TaxID=33097 RepID=A0A150G7J1_GONPE|nr:hypothetical protein GPECTOR_53g101 [Gonium pectorale]|eukprot:KXZ45515.1 hypothetical protein GPECTOR_53g101 [Gonium pectorale]
MTAHHEEDARDFRACADEANAMMEDSDQQEAPPAASPTVTRVPLHGPVDSHDVMCAKVIFALCGSVFPHPLLLAQQLLGIEDQDFPEFQLNVAEAGNNCIDIVAAYLTNLRVMQQEEEPNPPVSLTMIQPRHAATVASVAAKARDLMCELSLARATVKPRKAPKNKAIESAARAAAVVTPAGPISASSAGTGSSSTLNSSVEGDSSNSNLTEESALSDLPSDAGVAFGEDTCGSESNDDASSCGGLGHQDTSREDGTPRTAREEEERLLYALQGPAAAEETLKIARARPAGCKGSQANAEPRSASAAEAPRSGASGPVQSSSLSSGPNGAVPSSSPRAMPPPPPPARTSSNAAQGSGFGPAPGPSRVSHESSRGAGRGNTNQQAASGLQTALSCPVTGLNEIVLPPGGPVAHSSGQGQSAGQQPHSQGHRRGGGGPQQAGGMNGSARRNGGGTRASPTPPNQQQQQAAHHQAQQQQLQQAQQQQLAVAQLLGLRSSPSPYGSNSYQNLMALQGAYAANAASGLSAFAAANGGRLDLNSMAALELAAAQQAAAINAAAAGGMAAHLGFGTAGFGSQAGNAAAMSGLGPLAGQFGAASGGLGGLGGPALVHSSPQQQAAAAAAVLLQQGGGMLLPDALKGPQVGAGSAVDAWSTLLQAQLAGSLA